MAIKYDKLFALLQEKGFTTYRLRKEKIMGNKTYQSIKDGTGGLDYRSINKLCKVLGVQPGDLMEYVDDPTEDEEAAE